jgi:hypothetical protein
MRQAAGMPIARITDPVIECSTIVVHAGLDRTALTSCLFRLSTSLRFRC